VRAQGKPVNSKNWIVDQQARRAYSVFFSLLVFLAGAMIIPLSVLASGAVVTCRARTFCPVSAGVSRVHSVDFAGPCVRPSIRYVRRCKAEGGVRV
jgi:hypothetical protein